MAYLHRAVHWLIVVGIWFTVAYKPVQGGSCKVENGTETRIEQKTYKFLYFFEFTVGVDRKYPAYTCCEGYHGEQCDQITDACRQNASCRGYWCETEEPHYCTFQERTDQSFMGVYTRPVEKLCDKPLKKEHCCTGFSGKTCATKKANELLSEREVEKIKKQLITDEGMETEIRTFAGVKMFGIGHVIKKEDPEYILPDKTPVSEERIEEAFTADLHIAASDVAKLFKEQSKEWLSEVKEIVVNIMFNTTINGFKRILGLDGDLMRRQWHYAAAKLKSSALYRGARLVEELQSLVVDSPDGDFTEWSDWSQCTSTCERGGVIFDQIRTRSCKEGRICDGKIRKTRPCHITERDRTNYEDYLCTCKSGTCGSSECPSGLKEKGLCGGGKYCCLPEAQKLNCTNDWAQNYSCKILENHNNGKIILKDADGNGNSYAGALQNIKDACAGLSASRSYYNDSDCKNPGAPGGEICLTATLLKFIFDVSERELGLKLTSLAGHNHICTSYHYKGKAVDMSLPDNTSVIGDLCRNSLKGVFIDKYKKNPHWHCAVVKPDNVTDPDPDAPCEDINGICQEGDECEGILKNGLCYTSQKTTRKCCVWKRKGGSG